MKVGVIKCDRYQKDLLKDALTRSVGLLGGFENIIEPDDKVLLKPNLLLAAKPDRAVTTHPLFLEACIEIISQHIPVGNITIADSPGAGIAYTAEKLNKVYRQTGIMDVAQKTGCVLNQDPGYQTVALKEGKAIKKIDVINPALEADKIINLCKWKTHTLTTMTGAVKNMFGVVPGFSKVGHHLRFTSVEAFTQMLVDIACHMKPALSIMDGILGMEGEGPGMKGTPRHIGLVLASTDCLAMDAVVAKLMGLDTESLPLLRLEGVPAFDDIQLRGEISPEYVIKDFILPTTAGRKQVMENRFANKYLMPLAKTLLNPYPVTDQATCTLCGTCQKVCPHQAIKIRGKQVKFDYRRCLRCFCCSELCPEGAVSIKYKWLANLLLNKAGWGGKRKALKHSEND